MQKKNERSKYPRVLIISHNCFSLSGSNGRTLGTFFEGYPKEKLSQLFIVDECPDWDLCNRYYRITDKDILRAIVTFKNPGKDIRNIVGETKNKDVSQDDFSGVFLQRIKNSTASLLFREWIWASPFWKKDKLNNWVKEFNPEIILFQAGNLGYLCELSKKFAERFHVPLIVYNSEGYYFKKYDYVKGTLNNSPIFNVYMRIFKRKFSCMMEKVEKAIYISEDLKKAYDRQFKCESYYIMTPTTNQPSRKDEQEVNSVNKISYLGNLGLGRHKSLMEIANVLQKNDERLFIDVYGKAPDNEILQELEVAKGIRYKGFVSYDQVIDIINNSDINIHVEGFDQFYIEDSKYAFSTKIADLLAAKKAILIYAPANLTSTKYIAENQCGCVVTNPDELESKLFDLINDKELRYIYAERAKELADKNHDIERNRKLFQQLLMESRK